VDRFLASRPALELTFDSFEGGAELRYCWFDLASHASPVLPQQPQTLWVSAGFEVPLLSTTIQLPGMEGGENVQLGAVVISPRSPVFWCR